MVGTLDVTVAICTWNRRPLLEQTLASLEKMRPGATRWDLLIVDNGSTDGTAELVHDWIERGTLPLRYVVEPTLGLSQARNRAVREARAEWLLFTDDDVLVDPCWLEAFVASARRHPLAGAIGGRVDPWFVERPDPEMCRAFPALAKGFCGLNLGPEEAVVPEEFYLVGANFGIRIDPARPAPFHTRLGAVGANPIGGEEVAYQMELRRAGHDIIWCPAMRVKHYVDPQRMRLEYLQEFYTNVGRHFVMLNGVPQGSRLAGVPRWLFRLFRRYVEHAASRVTNAILGKRVAALDAMRQRALIGGMIAECRRSAAHR
jgi:glycosyltransferase involved in cell wall biosynthesis